LDGKVRPETSGKQPPVGIRSLEVIKDSGYLVSIEQP
jgi:hypothetical protein